MPSGYHCPIQNAIQIEENTMEAISPDRVRLSAAEGQALGEDCLRRVGYDAESGVVNMPDALPSGQIHGCGGDTCS